MNDLMQAPVADVATPRTNAMAQWLSNCHVVFIEDARTVERELAALDAELERAQNRLGLMEIDYEHCRAELARVAAELAEFKAFALTLQDWFPNLNNVAEFPVDRMSFVARQLGKKIKELAQTRSELETVKRERDEASQELIAAYGENEGLNVQLAQAFSENIAAQQTIVELNCKLAKYEKK